jgi:hypothetical protein
LAREQPAKVTDAIKICEQFDAREKVKPYTAKFVAAMTAAGAGAPATVDNVNAGGGYRGPKARGRGRGRGQPRGGGQQDRGISCFRCNKVGHIAKNCTAPFPAARQPDASTRARGGGTAPSRGRGRAVHDVRQGYAVYAEEQERLDFPWHPSYLPEFNGDPAAALYAAYEQLAGEVNYFEAYEVNTQLELPVLRETYGYGTPYRRAPINSVSKQTEEWWVPVTINCIKYQMKVDTGARVNVVSVADLSRWGLSRADLRPTSVYLVGFNAAVVQPCGEVKVVVKINGVSFCTNMVVVEQFNTVEPRLTRSRGNEVSR